MVVWPILIICCNTNHAAVFQFSTTKIYFLFLEIRNPREISSWAFSQGVSQGAVTGAGWSTCKATHMGVACPWSLLPYGQRQQFLENPSILSHPAAPPLSKWPEKETKERCPGVWVLEETCFYCHMLLITQSSHEYRMGKHYTKTQLPGRKEGPMEPLDSGYQHAFVGSICLGIYFSL